MIIYGAGGLGREVAAEFNSRAQPNMAVVDDGTNPPESWPRFSTFVVAVGDPKTRERMTQQAYSAGHIPMALVSKRAHCRVEPGDGSLIMPGAILTTDIRIGRGVLVNIGATIGHDCVLGDFCSIQPGANLTGRVHVGRRAYIGIGATLICRGKEPLIIGDDAIIGGGAVVIEDVPDGVTVAGNPARRVA